MVFIISNILYFIIDILLINYRGNTIFTLNLVRYGVVVLYIYVKISFVHMENLYMK